MAGEAFIRGWFWLAIVFAVAGYAVSVLFGIALVTAILLMVVIYVACIIGILVTLFIPLPIQLKFLAGLVSTIVSIWYGARLLGVIH
jgi:hypothetical protein